MANAHSGKMIVGLDIGTSKVVALVGEVGEDGTLEIVGIGTHPSRGLKKGVVVNIESTVQSIQRAVEEAQLMAGCRIHSAFVGVAGNHIRSLNSHASSPSATARSAWPTWNVYSTLPRPWRFRPTSACCTPCRRTT